MSAYIDWIVKYCFYKYSRLTCKTVSEWHLDKVADWPSDVGSVVILKKEQDARTVRETIVKNVV